MQKPYIRVLLDFLYSFLLVFGINLYYYRVYHNNKSTLVVILLSDKNKGVRFIVINDLRRGTGNPSPTEVLVKIPNLTLRITN